MNREQEKEARKQRLMALSSETEAKVPEKVTTTPKVAKKKNGSSKTQTATKVLQQAATTPFKMLMQTVLNYVVLIAILAGLAFGVIALGIPAFKSLFQATSPWAEQRQEIAKKNNVRDAYSAIAGSDVGVISQNGILKWFNSKEAKEIDISLPKLINYSPLFDDDSDRSGIKQVFEDSINEEMNKSTDVYKIYYDGSLLATYANGVKKNSSNDLNLTTDVKAEIKDDLVKKIGMKKKLTFKNWSKRGGQELVEFNLDEKKKEVNIIGEIDVEGKVFFLSDRYNLSVTYKNTGGKWEIVENTLKVEKSK
ncbi:hypothetical protein SAMN02745116_02211 [Pilibacter termitis]|jgi:hypothetical protein|uniref:Uncharacterized protein n=1 Tax=Pilibacter termitis TaxID=263852 RepID=A0A1T4QJC2_9ENTE|nr:hypothetical protein [Pilibacter termitis]SKA03784.1 hypothetical protein SAMN02745116_02211 [Pilibacter termitis]